jgi:ABC-2 type transport system permease protein
MIKQYFRTIGTLCLMLSKRWSRDPVALFFIFLFPLIFLLVFGALFRDSDVSFDVALLNRSNTQYAAEFVDKTKHSKIFKVDEEITSFDMAKDKMGHGEIDSIIELPEGFGTPDEKGQPNGKVVVYYEASSPQTGQTVSGIMQQLLDTENETITQVVDPLEVEEKATETSDLTRFDYTLAGMIGFSIMSLAIFGMADKKTGALRRLRATPLRSSQLILATALEFLIVGILSVALMLIVALTLFDFHMRGSYITLMAFTLIGIFCLFGFGLAIGGWAKNENQSAPLANLVAFPMMFLSGIFFPVFLMPEWLQNVAQFVPLTPIIDGIRMIITENATLLDLGPQLAIVGIWTVVIYALAIRVFRWE